MVTTAPVLTVPLPAPMEIPPENFNVLTDALPDDYTLPAFMVSKTRGFLPRAVSIINITYGAPS